MPVEVRRRRRLDEGGSVEIVDRGDALIMVPAGRGGLRALLGESIDASDGYAELVAAVVADEPDLA